MLRSPTTLASWVGVIHRTLISHGCDADRILAQAGIPPEELRQPHARVPIAQTSRLWQLAVQASGDSAFGLSVASHVRANTFHALGLSLAASPTLFDAFGRLLRYFRIVSDAGELRFEQVGECCHFELHVPEDHAVSPEAVDAFMSCIVRMCRSLASPQKAEPLELGLRRPQPLASERFTQAFRCPVHFAAPCNRLSFRLVDLQARLRDGDANLAMHHDPILVKMLAQVDEGNLQERIRGLLVELLPQGGVTQEVLAQRLGLSMRTLQRRLQQQAVSYSAILDEARMAVAQRLLAQEFYALGEVAYLLGFSDLSAFSRFFKRATGQAPGSYRRAHQRPGSDPTP